MLEMDYSYKEHCKILTNFAIFIVKFNCKIILQFYCKILNSNFLTKHCYFMS